MVSDMISVVRKDLEVFQTVVQGVPVLMVNDVAGLKVKEAPNLLSGNPLALPVFDVQPPVPRIEIGIVAFGRTEQVLALADLASDPLDLFPTARARHLEPFGSGDPGEGD